MHTWQQLRELRHAGQQPRLCLAIVSPGQYRLAANFADIGAMVIEHHEGDTIPIELLADLDVLLLLDSCKHALPFARAMRDVEDRWGRCRSWCQCSKTLSFGPDSGCKL